MATLTPPMGEGKPRPLLGEIARVVMVLVFPILVLLLWAIKNFGTVVYRSASATVLQLVSVSDAQAAAVQVTDDVTDWVGGISAGKIFTVGIGLATLGVLFGTLWHFASGDHLRAIGFGLVLVLGLLTTATMLLAWDRFTPKPKGTN